MVAALAAFGVDLAPVAGPAQHTDQLSMRQRPSLVRGRRQLEHGHRVPAARVAAEGGQRRRVERPQRASHQVGLPLPRPDQLLMPPGQHLDRLDQARVAGHLAVMMPVGADQIGQHPRIPTVGLGPRGGVPLPVAAGRQRIDRIHPVAGPDQRADQQAPVGLDPDHHLGRFLRPRAHQLVQPGHPGHPISDPLAGQHASVGGHDAHIMVALRPIDPDKQHRGPLPSRPVLPASRRTAAT